MIEHIEVSVCAPYVVPPLSNNSGQWLSETSMSVYASAPEQRPTDGGQLDRHLGDVPVPEPWLTGAALGAKDAEEMDTSRKQNDFPSFDYAVLPDDVDSTKIQGVLKEKKQHFAESFSGGGYAINSLLSKKRELADLGVRLSNGDNGVHSACSNHAMAHSQTIKKVMGQVHDLDLGLLHWNITYLGHKIPYIRLRDTICIIDTIDNALRLVQRQLENAASETALENSHVRKLIPGRAHKPEASSYTRAIEPSSTYSSDNETLALERLNRIHASPGVIDLAKASPEFMNMLSQVPEDAIPKGELRDQIATSVREQVARNSPITSRRQVDIGIGYPRAIQSGQPAIEWTNRTTMNRILSYPAPLTPIDDEPNLLTRHFTGD